MYKILDVQNLPKLAQAAMCLPVVIGGSVSALGCVQPQLRAIPGLLAFSAQTLHTHTHNLLQNSDAPEKVIGLLIGLLNYRAGGYTSPLGVQLPPLGSGMLFLSTSSLLGGGSGAVGGTGWECGRQ